MRTIIDMVVAKSDGRPDVKYVLVKDPNKPLLRLYEVPVGTFEDVEEEEGEGEEGEEADGDADEA